MCGKIKIYVGVLCYVNIELHSEILEYPKVNLKKKTNYYLPRVLSMERERISD